MNKLEVLDVIFEALKDSLREDMIFISLGIDPESPLRASNNILFEGLVDTAMLITGDIDGWINWYVYDNDLGRKAMEAGMPGALKPITNAKELLEVM